MGSVRCCNGTPKGKMERLYEHTASGLQMRVLYSVRADGVCEYEDIRVLDADYRSVGPNLVDFLCHMLVTGEHPEGFAVTPFLSEVQEDL
jgi:hypothetical protein